MYRIILAEDNPGDVLLFREALRSSNLVCELIVAEDGERALALLETTGMPGSTSRPDLIVLDVNLPKHSGQEVLRWVRRHPILASTPVIVVTSAASPHDKTKATLLEADLCIQKSSNLDEVFEIGATLRNFLRDKKAER